MTVGNHLEKTSRELALTSAALTQQKTAAVQRPPMPQRREPAPQAGTIEPPKSAGIPDRVEPKPTPVDAGTVVPEKVAQEDTKPIVVEPAAKKADVVYPTYKEWMGVPVTKQHNHSDGGSMLILEGGDRVKVNAAGKELDRVSGGLEVQPGDVKPATELLEEQEEAEEGVEVSAYAIPEKAFNSSRMRDVLYPLIMLDITDKDSLVDACVDLKDQGAKSLKLIRNGREGIERRVKMCLDVIKHGQEKHNISDMKEWVKFHEANPEI